MPVRPIAPLLLALALVLAGCGYIPRQVAGLPPGVSWDALPLRKWLAEDRAEPVALSFCAPPECRPGLAVSVVRLTGRDARITESLLNDPERLARALRSPAGRAKPVTAKITVERFDVSSYQGFAITLAPADGGKKPAHGVALGRRTDGALMVVLAIGEEADAVRETARAVAERELGS